MGEAIATLVIGASLNTAADLLKAATGVPDHRFPGLLGLDACDEFTQALPAPAGRSRASAPGCRTRWSIAGSRLVSRTAADRQFART